MRCLFEGRSVETEKGAEECATKLSDGILYEMPRASKSRYAVRWGMSEASLQARLFQAYCQGRADEAATRECPKSFPAKGWCECCRQPESVCDCLGPSSEASNGP